jgi:Sec-independent protein translocase protein TatA
MRALRGLFGPGKLKKAGESWRALKTEFRRGAKETEATEEGAPLKKIPHRDVDAEGGV